MVPFQMNMLPSIGTNAFLIPLEMREAFELRAANKSGGLFVALKKEFQI